jgi:hypothetical protein
MIVLIILIYWTIIRKITHCSTTAEYKRLISFEDFSPPPPLVKHSAKYTLTIDFLPVCFEFTGIISWA